MSEFYTPELSTGLGYADPKLWIAWRRHLHLRKGLNMATIAMTGAASISVAL